MGPASLAQKGDVAQRRVAVPDFAVGNVRDGLEMAAFDILGVGPEMAVAPTRDALGPVEVDEAAARDLVEHAPDFRLWIGTDIGGRRSSDRAAFEIEAESIATNAAGPRFERAHTSPLAEGAVVHVGAKGQIPDLIPGPAVNAQSMEPVLEAGEKP